MNQQEIESTGMRLLKKGKKGLARMMENKQLLYDDKLENSQYVQYILQA